MNTRTIGVVLATTPFAASAATLMLNPGEILWQNPHSFIGGMSNYDDGTTHRSLIDDFEVEPPGWIVTQWHTKHAWADGSTGTGTDTRLTFYRDAGGAPDFDQLVAVAENRSYMEMRDPANPDFFGLTVVDIWVAFDPVHLEPGRYWVDMSTVGPVNGFQLKAATIRLSPLWVDYDDFGGRQPGQNVFGVNYDTGFILVGELACTADCPVYADDFTLNFGAHQSGTVEDLRDSDDVYMVFEPRPGLTASLPLIRVHFEGNTGFESVSSMGVTYESSVNSVPTRPPQRLSLFNYLTNAWEHVDDRTATLNDSVVEVQVTGDPDRFIEAGTAATKMRAEYFNPGNVFLPSWVARIDQAIWTVTP